MLTYIATGLLIGSGAAGMAAIAGLARSYPDRRTAAGMAVACLIAACAAGLVQHFDTAPAPTPATVHPLPDPDDCVQLGWLNDAWRCIPVEEAG